MRKLTILMLGIFLVLAIGCSGGNQVTLPPIEKEAAVGSFEISDLDGNLVSAGTLVRDDNGKLALGEIRSGDLLIDLTWIGWFDAAAEYLNPRTYLPSGWPVFYQGDNMQYNVHITNVAFTIPNAFVSTEQRYYYGGGLCGGDSVEEWFNVNLPGNDVTSLYDEWVIVMHPGYGATWCVMGFSFNIWCIDMNFILYNGICGIWEP